MDEAYALLNTSRSQTKKKWLVLFGTGIAGVTIGLDLTIVNSSLPNIQYELGANINQLQWIMAGFGLFFCAFLVVMGRFGDIYGRKKFLISSLTFLHYHNYQILKMLVLLQAPLQLF